MMFLQRGPNLSHSSIIRPSTAASPNPAQPQTPAYPRIEPIEPIHDLAEPNGPGAFPIPALEEATMPVHTLPPSIVLAPARPAPEIRDNRIENERYTEFALRTQQPDEVGVVNSINCISLSKLKISLERLFDAAELCYRTAQ